MADRRLELQSELESIPGIARVYWNPPETIKLIYPCIIYSLSNNMVRHADNKAYLKRKRYEVTIIDKNPTSLIYEDFEDRFTYWELAQTFPNDNLMHWVYTLYY